MFGFFEGKSFSAASIPDLQGKVILVTGGNTGLGLETIRQLVAHGAQVYLTARTPSKGQTAVREIKQSIPSANIVFLQLDLSSFASIATAAKDFTSQSQRLDILVNNAGVMALPPGTTEEGYEIQLGTNHMGHALLTKLLMPTLLATTKQPSADVRIINLSSEAHNMARNAKILFDRVQLDASNAWTRYAYSKLANILFTRELARRYPNITSVAVHPGLIKTDLWLPNQQSNPIMKYALMIGGSLRSSVVTGATNSLWAATGAKEGIVNGMYYTPVGNLGGSSYARNGDLARKFWDWTEDDLGTKGY